MPSNVPGIAHELSVRPLSSTYRCPAVRRHSQPNPSRCLGQGATPVGFRRSVKIGFIDRGECWLMVLPVNKKCQFTSCSGTQRWTILDHDDEGEPASLSDEGHCPECRFAAIDCLSEGCTEAWRPLNAFLRKPIESELRKFFKDSTHPQFKELYQETVIKLFRRFARGDMKLEGSLAAYAKTAARNNVIDDYRRRKGADLSLDDLNFGPWPEEETIEKGPHVIQDRAEFFEVIRGLNLPDLSDEDYQILGLLYEGYTQQAIGHLLGKHQTTIFRAIRRFRALLQEKKGESDV